MHHVLVLNDALGTDSYSSINVFLLIEYHTEDTCAIKYITIFFMFIFYNGVLSSIGISRPN